MFHTVAGPCYVAVLTSTCRCDGVGCDDFQLAFGDRTCARNVSSRPSVCRWIDEHKVVAVSTLEDTRLKLEQYGLQVTMCLSVQLAKGPTGLRSYWLDSRETTSSVSSGSGAVEDAHAQVSLIRVSDMFHHCSRRFG